MKHRKLRIAWSVVWGLLAVLLIVLWVRSYWWNDSLLVRTKSGGLIEVQSLHGQLNYLEHAPFPPLTSIPRPLIFVHQWIRDEHPDPAYDWPAKWPRLGLVHNPPAFPMPTILFTIPTWLSAVISLFMAVAAPRTSWHFSLRTLLVATTLVAVGLGLIVWLTRK